MATMIKCKFCGKEVDSRGIKLHELQCSANPMNKANVPQKKEVEKPQKSGECEHSWRMLSRKKQIENLAIQDGHKEVCQKCQTLR